MKPYMMHSANTLFFFTMHKRKCTQHLPVSVALWVVLSAQMITQLIPKIPTEFKIFILGQYTLFLQAV